MYIYIPEDNLQATPTVLFHIDPPFGDMDLPGGYDTGYLENDLPLQQGVGPLPISVVSTSSPLSHHEKARTTKLWPVHRGMGLFGVDLMPSPASDTGEWFHSTSASNQTSHQVTQHSMLRCSKLHDSIRILLPRPLRNPPAAAPPHPTNHTKTVVGNHRAAWSVSTLLPVELFKLRKGHDRGVRQLLRYDRQHLTQSRRIEA